MKKYLFIAVILGIILPVFAWAQSNVNANLSSDPKIEEAQKILDDPGILPDNKLYVLKEWWEDVQVFFTFNNAKKAELENKLALKRIAETSKLIDKGKTDLAEQHLARFQRHLEKFQDRVEKMKDMDADKAAELTAKLEALQQRQQEVLSEVYDRVPEKVKEKILQAMENSSQGLENAIEKIKGNVEAEQFRERMKKRLENSSEDFKNKIKDRLELNGSDDDVTNIN